MNDYTELYARNGGRAAFAEPAAKAITVQIKQVYGNETIYPACPQAVFFCALARTKTITEDMLRLIRAQGYAVTVEAPALRFRGER